METNETKGGTVLVLEFTAPESFASLVCEITILSLIPIYTTFFLKSLPSAHLNDSDVRTSVSSTTGSFYLLLLCLCSPLPPCQQGFQNIFTLLSTFVFFAVPLPARSSRYILQYQILIFSFSLIPSSIITLSAQWSYR